MTTTTQQNAFGAWLKARREERNFSLDELRERAGHVCSKSYLSMLENNKSSRKDGRPMQPDILIVDALATALGTPVNEARRAAGWSDADLAIDEVAEEFTRAMAKYKTLSPEARKFAKKHLTETLEFLSDADKQLGSPVTASDTAQQGYIDPETVDDSDGQTINIMPHEDVPEITPDQAKELGRRSKSRQTEKPPPVRDKGGRRKSK